MLPEKTEVIIHSVVYTDFINYKNAVKKHHGYENSRKQFANYSPASDL